MGYTVKAVADVAGVSVRTLHHYDRLGLLRPAATSPAGYRLYSEADLERLQQVLFFRELRRCGPTAASWSSSRAASAGWSSWLTARSRQSKEENP